MGYSQHDFTATKATVIQESKRKTNVRRTNIGFQFLIGVPKISFDAIKKTTATPIQ
jgi:hypothetical protein